MTSSVIRQSSFSSRSISGGLSLNRGGVLFGGQSSLSRTRGVQSSTSSMYGGAGGYGTRISESILSPTQYNESAVIGNEKFTMQNLNDRLASYLDKVRSLEAANNKLELQIREFYEKRSPAVSRDVTGFLATITDLRAQIVMKHSENQRVVLQIDNAQLAADDFKTKYETELNMRSMVEADVMRLRGVRDSLTLAQSDLESQLESLKEELLYMKSDHQESMQLLNVQQTGMVEVTVDAPAPDNLADVLLEMREHYESVMMKNKLELEKWFQSVSKDLVICTIEEVNTYSTELSELKRTYQSLEISRQSMHTQIQYLQQSIEEVKQRYSLQLSQLQTTIDSAEKEIQLLTVSIEQQQTDYKLLLDIKMRLELEIAEYRRLLDGTLERGLVDIKKEVLIVKTLEVEEHKPHIEVRTKTITEKLVDGLVVSSTVDTEVEDIQ